MALFITLSEGPTGATARPVLATGDPRIIRAVLDAIQLLGVEDEDEDDEESSPAAKVDLFPPVWLRELRDTTDHGV